MNSFALPLIEIDNLRESPSLEGVSQRYAEPIEQVLLSQETAQLSPELAVIRQPDSALTESIRAARTQLLLRGFPSSRKTVVVAGISQNCGASLFSANLAALFSQVGEKTLLVDANMRNPTVHHIFNLNNSSGLSDVLTHRTTLSEALFSIDALPNLTLLAAGAVQSDASELLSASAFNALNTDLTGQFDIIFYDTPAFLESTDALMVAKYSGCVLLVVHRNQSRLTDVNAVCQQITGNGIEIIGSVLVDY
jgi:capsular exopolysaccharide synthesis family protein